MKRAVVLIMLSFTLFTGCKKKEAASTRSPNPGQANAAPSSPPMPQRPEPSLISFSAGALIVQKPQEYGNGWTAFNMLDENPKTGWAAPKGVTTDQVTVIELPERTLLKRLEFDTGSVDGGQRSAKDVVVEMSDTGSSDGFKQIASVSLMNRLDHQQFPVSAEVPGRWVRLTAKDNFGAADYLELMDFQGFGTQLTHTPFPDVSGTYQTGFGALHLLQQGTSVTGCYEHAGGLLTGGVEGRVLRLTWTQEDGKSRGPAVMVFSPNGQNLYGLWWIEGHGQDAGGVWDGSRKTTTVGSCPNWRAVGAQDQIGTELEKFGRSRVYGINFDSDSDQITDESKPTLDKIVALMKAKPDWKLTIEGHTDSTAMAEYDQKLSERRAIAVGAYLVIAGIKSSRLTPVGYGATRPVAKNDTALGRTQNRRIELTKTKLTPAIDAGLLPSGRLLSTAHS
jgi:outer membrane protein OmpA-like peptidoglycan-associated protein